MAYDVTPVGKLEKEIKANKDCTENVNVINDVTSVSDDGMGNKAHKECAKHVTVAYDVTKVDIEKNGTIQRLC